MVIHPVGQDDKHVPPAMGTLSQGFMIGAVLSLSVGPTIDSLWADALPGAGATKVNDAWSSFRETAVLCGAGGGRGADM